MSADTYDRIQWHRLVHLPALERCWRGLHHYLLPLIAVSDALCIIVETFDAERVSMVQQEIALGCVEYMYYVFLLGKIGYLESK